MKLVASERIFDVQLPMVIGVCGTESLQFNDPYYDLFALRRVIVLRWFNGHLSE